MDKGAHYIKADLQAHTARDPNWKHSCKDDEAREQFADEFVQACRKASLGAVAITDHHDFVTTLDSSPSSERHPYLSGRGEKAQDSGVTIRRPSLRAGWIHQPRKLRLPL